MTMPGTSYGVFAVWHVRPPALTGVLSTATHATVQLAALTHLTDHQIQNLLRVRFLEGLFVVMLKWVQETCRTAKTLYSPPVRQALPSDGAYM